MKRVLLKSVFDAFDYVMEHYYPYGLEEFAVRSDTYAVISIQDTHTDGFGFEFRKNHFCRDVLTLYFDDITSPIDGAVMFSDAQADRIIDFILSNRDAETLLVHCYGGQSRSRAVAAFAAGLLGGDASRCLHNGNPNEHVYRTLQNRWTYRTEK